MNEIHRKDGVRGCSETYLQIRKEELLVHDAVVANLDVQVVESKHVGERGKDAERYDGQHHPDFPFSVALLARL